MPRPLCRISAMFGHPPLLRDQLVEGLVPQPVRLDLLAPQPDQTIGSFDSVSLACCQSPSRIKFVQSTFCQFGFGGGVVGQVVFGCLLKGNFGLVGRSFHGICVDFKGELLAHDFLLVLRENEVFIKDYITTLDQFLVLWIPQPIPKFPIGSITEKYAWSFSPMG